jgi:HEAT repeat protein
MPRFLQFQFDNFSFILGLIFAVSLWWAISRIRELINKEGVEKTTKEQVLPEPVKIQKATTTTTVNLPPQKLQNNIGDIYRREIYFFAQKQHLAAKYCPLHEILIEPNLIAAPYEMDPTIPFPPETLTSQIVPYLPDFPEFISQFPFPRISAIDTLRNGVNIVVYGPSGSGKSVVLANLASAMCVDYNKVDEVKSRIPIFIHWLDLDYEDQKENDPFDILLSAVNTQNFLRSKSNCLTYLKQSISTDRFLLILDGLDELCPDEYQTAGKFLESLIRKYPNIQFITTASEDYFDGLHRLGTRAFCVASWSRMDRNDFFSKWQRLWQESISATRIEKSTDEIAYLMQKWLAEDDKILTPFEWTLRLWGLYSGKLKGLSTMDLIDAYIEQISGNSYNPQNLVVYSTELFQQRKSAFSYSNSEKLLSKNLKPNTSLPAEQAKQENKAKNKKISSSGEIIIRSLVDNFAGAFHGKDKFSINHILITAYCASIVDNQIPAATQQPFWSLDFERIRFLASRVREPAEINTIIENEDLPLHRNLMVAARFLKDSPLESRWRVNLMRRLVYLIKQDTLPLGLRASFMAVAVASGDNSLSVLFKQLFTSTSPLVRRISALGAGVARDRNVTQELIRLLGDPSLEVRCTACLALSNLPTSSAWQAIVDALLKGEEHLQQIAAECLAASGEKGYDVLKNVVTFDNILVRRAAVIGFSQVREKWCVSLLEKIAVEDGQWVVRNAASQALEMIHQKNVYIPRHISNPDGAAWLIQYAAKQGTTLTEGEFPKAMLLQALAAGNQEEKLAALNYLRLSPDENILKAFYDNFYNEQSQQRDTVFQYLWWMMVSGIKLPSPIQYGYK